MSQTTAPPQGSNHSSASHALHIPQVYGVSPPLSTSHTASDHQQAFDASITYEQEQFYPYTQVRSIEFTLYVLELDFH